MRPMAIGIWGGVSGLGVAVGPVVGGAIVQGISWEAIFWVNVPIAVLAVALLRVAVPESRGAFTRLDLVGTGLLGGAVFLATWGIVHGNDDGWTSPGVLTLLIGAALLLLAYLPWAARRRGRGAAAAAVPVAKLLGRERRRALLRPGHVRRRLPALAVPPDRRRATARSRPASARLPWTAAPMAVAPLAGVLAPQGRCCEPCSSVGSPCRPRRSPGSPSSPRPVSTTASFVPPLALAGIGMGLTFAPSLDGRPPGPPARGLRRRAARPTRRSGSSA